MPWLASLDREKVRAHCVGLADQLRGEPGDEPADSAITLVRRPGAPGKLAAAGVVAATRNGLTRLAFHLYNTEADAHRTLDALAR